MSNPGIDKVQTEQPGTKEKITPEELQASIKLILIGITKTGNPEQARPFGGCLTDADKGIKNKYTFFNIYSIDRWKHCVFWLLLIWVNTWLKFLLFVS